VLDQDGTVTGVALVMEDITTRRRLDDELAKLDKLESLAMLASGVAHDFNNVLAGILGNVSIARQLIAPDLPAADRLRKAERAAERAGSLTRQLMDLAKGGEPVKSVVATEPLIREAAEFALSGSTTRCAFHLPRDLWNVEVDRSQIERVVANLVLNAAQAMPDPGTVEVTATNLHLTSPAPLPLAPGKYVRVAVTDHGVGIPLEHLQKVFDPFFTTKKEGTGLGLTTSFTTLKRHRGYITVDSQPKRGSTFTFYLPATDREPAGTTPPQAAPVPLPPHPRILVMDDDEAVREVVREILVSTGCEVVPAANPADAVGKYQEALAREEPFDLVLLDLQVDAGRGGLDTLRALRNLDPAVRGLVSSGRLDAAALEECRRAGFAGTIAKPFVAEDLRQAVHHALQAPPGKMEGRNRG
jgi:nitrogen-specific signal transduction histidine kinase/ActR/RegA family two-component response regulator